MLKRDLDVLARLLDEDLTYTHSSGVTHTRQEYLESVASGNLVYEEIEIVPMVRMVGGAGVVHAVLRARLQLDGRRVALRGVYLAVWARREGRWTLRALQSTAASSPGTQ